MTDPFTPGLLFRITGLKKVAIVRASRIGDFICATPAFRALRTALPDSRITLIGLPFVKGLARRSACIDRFIPFTGFPGMAEQFFDARRAVRSLGRLQSERFDLAIQMHGTGVYSNTYTLLLGARKTVGFVREGDGPGRLDAALAMPSAGREAERLLALTAFLGAPEMDGACEFPLLPRDHGQARRLLQGAAPPFLGLHIYARKAEKRWPAERFAAAAGELRRRYGGTLVNLGERGQPAETGRLAQEAGPPFIDLTGRTSLPVLGAVIARLSILLTNDSGPAHIAYALGVPAVTIFGETDPARWGPPPAGPFRAVRRILPCRPCGENGCASGYACLRSIQVDEVVEAASEVIRVP